jgi:hypothetical protein
MRKILMALAMAAAVGCGSDSSTGTSGSVQGTYTLRSVNGATLPYTFFTTGTTKVEITDDVIVLSSAGTWTETGTTRTTNGGTVSTQTSTDAGTYTTNGTAISLRSNDGSTVSGTNINGSMTLVDAGLSAVYTK